MYRIFFIITLTALSLFVSAQDQDLLQEEQDQKKKPKGQDMLILDFNFNYWLNAADSIEISPWSRGFNIYLMYDMPFGKSNFSFATGAGFSSHNVFNNVRVVRFDTAETTFSTLVPFDEDAGVKSHKLSTNYAEIPIEFRYRSKPNKKGNSLKISIGGKVGYLVNVHSKTKDKEGKHKSYDFENITEIRYGLMTRVSYGKVGLTYFYSLTSLFEENLGPEITPISAGISLMLF